MNLNRKYKVYVDIDESVFNVQIKIPKQEITEKKNQIHDINALFTEMLLFFNILKINGNLEKKISEGILENLISDLDRISNEICWIKCIHKEISEKMDRSLEN